MEKITRRPQEVVRFLEAFSNSMGLVNQLLYGDDAMFTKRWSNQGIICQGSSFLIDFTIAVLVDDLRLG